MESYMTKQHLYKIKALSLAIGYAIAAISISANVNATIIENSFVLNNDLVANGILVGDQTINITKDPDQDILHTLILQSKEGNHFGVEFKKGNNNVGLNIEGNLSLQNFRHGISSEDNREMTVHGRTDITGKMERAIFVSGDEKVSIPTRVNIENGIRIHDLTLFETTEIVRIQSNSILSTSELFVEGNQQNLVEKPIIVRVVDEGMLNLLASSSDKDYNSHTLKIENFKVSMEGRYKGSTMLLLEQGSVKADNIKILETNTENLFNEAESNGMNASQADITTNNITINKNTVTNGRLIGLYI